jgi:hypothetical protein
VVDLPEWRIQQGEGGGRLSRPDLRALRAEMNGILEAGGSADAIEQAMAERARALPFVAAAYRQSELLRGEATDSFATLYRNSLHPGRVADLLARAGVHVRLHEGTISDGTVRGTTHGSPYWYDRHVPLHFLGAGISAGRSSEASYTVDVAPTLAFLAGIPTPDDLDGHPLPMR